MSLRNIIFIYLMAIRKKKGGHFPQAKTNKNIKPMVFREYSTPVT